MISDGSFSWLRVEDYNQPIRVDVTNCRDITMNIVGKINEVSTESLSDRVDITKSRHKPITGYQNK